MKKYMRNVLLCLMIAPIHVSALNLQPVGLDSIKETVMPTTIKFFIGEDAAQKQNMLESLKVEYKAFVEKAKQQSDSIEKQMNSLKRDIDATKSGSYSGNSEFVSKKLHLLNKKYQILPDIREARQHIAEYMTQVAMHK